jgi:ribonuclease BN (tRNA processing enzyme)
MKLTFGGVRGTSPVAQPGFMKFGGETTSMLIQGTGGEQLLIDAGTGVRELGMQLAAAPASKQVMVLLTHFHLDHLMGLPSLQLIYRPDWSFLFGAPADDRADIGEIISRIMDPPYWPLQMEDLKSRLKFQPLEHRSCAGVRCGALWIRWCGLHHPGGSFAYRIDEETTGSSILLATDMEWSTSSAIQKKELLDLCVDPCPVDLLVMDGQYFPEVIDQYRGWGHSSWRDAAEVAEACGIGKLLITHHDPMKDDAALEQELLRARAVYPWIDFARDRMQVDLSDPIT